MKKDRLNINLEEIKDRVTWVYNNLDKYKGWIADTNIQYGLELMREELTEVNIKLAKIQQGTDPILEREERIKEYTEIAR